MNAVSGRVTPAERRARWVPLAKPLIGTMPDCEIARAVGTTTRSVAYLRRSLDKAPRPPGRKPGPGLPPVAVMVYRMLVEARDLLTVAQIADSVECSERRTRAVLRDFARWGFARESGVSDKGAPLWEVV